MEINKKTALNSLWRCMVVFVVLLAAQQMQAQNDSDLFPVKPEPAVYVHDYAGWLSAGEKAQLEQKLRVYHDSTSTQIVVMIRPDIGDYDKASYAFELGNRWGIGRKDKNNGIVMLIKSQPPDRGIFIATGYGTEGALPDITAGRIIRSTMAPYFQQQQYYQGIDAGLSDIIQALTGEFVNDGTEDSGNIGGALFVFLILFILLAVVFYRARKGKGTMFSNDSSGRTRRNGRNNNDPWGGGWWMGGGGGFGGGSGGGGGFGGGGGSFGGGSFGGGGAGGDW